MATTRGSEALRGWLGRQDVGAVTTLALALGVTRQAVSTWARGVARPTLEARLLLDAHTRGAVPAEAWLSRSELRAARRAAAARRHAVDPVALDEVASGVGACRVCGRLVERDDEGEWRYVERVEVAS